MGLNERRKIKELQETVLPERHNELIEITGAPITYEIDWESFENDLEALNFMDNVSCHRINMALRTICMDDLGKEAVAEGLKTIRLKNVQNTTEKSLTFSGGVLEIHYTYAQRSDGLISDGDIRKVLEAGL